ncbi:MAG: alpha-amylase family glycosyl hydrolase [Lachnospiraceae bacterium]|nr:alpha-amylase family glycosyl hydrolase [Lachnospiraceae bacterium]
MISKIRSKVASLRWLTLLAIVLSLLIGILTQPLVTHASTDISVDNISSFATDTIYQIVTDRFWDGNPANNARTSHSDPRRVIGDGNPWGSPNRNDRLYHGGDWAGITQKINDGYLTGLGITAIWIAPPMENIDYINPAGPGGIWTASSYHGYWAKDFFRPNPYFGTVADFQTLVATAHANGIKIVIDFVPNHTSATDTFDLPYNASAQYNWPEDGGIYRDGVLLGRMHDSVEATRKYFNHEPAIINWENLEESIYRSMSGLADLNLMNNTIDSYMKDAIKFWLNLGVDGIRVDAVKHMPLGWQKNWVSSIYQTKPVFIFGEWYDGGSTPDAKMVQFANESGMSVLDFSFANVTRRALGNLTANMQDIHNTIVSTGAAYKQVNNQVTFLCNHDMARFTTVANGHQPSTDAALVLQMTQRGVPAIYYGTEQYMLGDGDPASRGNMVSFDTNTNAYKIIAALAPLRKSNPALAYGTYTERWINNDVYIYERQFGDSVVLTAINRNTSQGYNITNLLTNLPAGTYNDVLAGVRGGSPITVPSNGTVPQYFLGAGVSAVWEFTSTTQANPIIGSVDPLLGIANNNVTITGRGFGSSAGSVRFGTTTGTVVGWSDNRITVRVPNVAAGTYNVSITTSGGVTSPSYPGFTVLTGPQTAVRFMVNNATTVFGQNIYLVGNVAELGSWDPNKAVGPMFNNTPSIGSYPTWFVDASVPVNTRIEYKFIKKDGAGNVVWEGGNNRVFNTGQTTGEVTGNWQ